MDGDGFLVQNCRPSVEHQSDRPGGESGFIPAGDVSRCRESSFISSLQLIQYQAVGPALSQLCLRVYPTTINAAFSFSIIPGKKGSTVGKLRKGRISTWYRLLTTNKRSYNKLGKAVNWSVPRPVAAVLLIFSLLMAITTFWDYCIVVQDDTDTACLNSRARRCRRSCKIFNGNSWAMHTYALEAHCFT